MLCPAKERLVRPRPERKRRPVAIQRPDPCHLWVVLVLCLLLGLSSRVGADPAGLQKTKTINISSTLDEEAALWLRQFPHSTPEWGDWKFIFNSDSEEYDYLVVFDDLHGAIQPRCPRENIIHLATEPPVTKRYKPRFLKQFAWVVTQDSGLERAGVIRHQPGLNWWVGSRSPTSPARPLNFSELETLADNPKSRLISVISSSKNSIPGHRERLKFVKKLKEHYGERLDVYGRGISDMEDKLESLADYRFQIVIENSSYDHYCSEKIMDCVLAGTYPIYYGCPNLGEYFPKKAYATIDIHDFKGAVAEIDRVIEQNLDKKYRTELLEARNRILYEHNLFPMLIKLIEGIEEGEFGRPQTPSFYGDEMLPRRQAGRSQWYLHLREISNENPLLARLRSAFRRLRTWAYTPV